MPTNPSLNTVNRRRVATLVSALLVGAGAPVWAQEEVSRAQEEERLREQVPTAAITTPILRAPLTRVDARMSTERACRTTATTLVPIPNTTVTFTQSSPQPQEVVVTFVAAWPQPRPADTPAGSTEAGAFIFLFVDDDRVDAVSENGGVLVHEGSAT